MSGWDWLHAGLEVATYAQARKAQQNLSGIKTAAEMEVARRALLEAMKSFIFDISRDIQLAEEQLSASPQQVYIISKSLDWRFINSGLSADIFPDFQDKEYVFKTQKKIAEVVSKSREVLITSQIEQSEKAIKYITEMPILQSAIVAKTAQESLLDTNDEWQELSSSAGNKSALILPGFLAILISCACMTLSLVGFGELFMRGGGGPMFFGGMLIFLGSGYFIYSSRQSDPDYADLKNERKTWENQLLPKDEWSMAVSLFGDLSSKQFQQIYQKRLEFLNPILGEDVQRYLVTKPEETEQIREEDNDYEVDDEEESSDTPSIDNALRSSTINKSSTSNSSSTVEQLQKLADLYKSGVLSDDEYRRAKEKVLSQN